MAINLRQLLLDRAARGIGTGGGLLNNKATGGLLGNLNPLFLGASIIGSGMQGRDPFSSVLPAATQAAQLQQLLTPEEKERNIIKDVEGRQRYADTGELVFPDVKTPTKEPKDRRIIKDIQGRQRYEDTGELVFPDVETPIKQKVQILSEKEKEELKLPKNRQFQRNPETGAITQIGGSQVEVNLGQPLTQGVSVSNQYEKESKNFIERNASRNQILALTQTKDDDVERTPQEDFDLVYAYYKFLDPGSTVRETEFANLERLGSVGRRIQKIIPKWKKGRLLTDEQVKEIRSSMEKQFSGFADEQRTRYNRFSRLLSESNLDPNLFLQNYTKDQSTEKPTPKENQDEIDYSSLSTEELLKLYSQ